MAQIQDNLTKASVFGIEVGGIGDQIASLWGLLWPTQDDYYDDNDLYHATFTADGGTYSDDEKRKVSNFIQKLWLNSNSWFKPKITIKKVKRNGTSWIIYWRTDGINNHSAVQQAAQSFINDVSDQYHQGWAYEVNIQNDGMLSDDKKTQQEATAHAYNSALQGKYFDGTTISKASFQKYKNNDGFFDLQSFLKDSFNAQMASENWKVTRKALVANVGGDAVWENLVKRAYMENHDGGVSALEKFKIGATNTLMPFYNYTEDAIGDGAIGAIAKFLKVWDYDDHLLAITNNGKDVNALLDILSDENYWNNDNVGSFLRWAAQIAPDVALALGTMWAGAIWKTAAVQWVKQGIEKWIKNKIKDSIASKLITASNFGIGTIKKVWTVGLLADDAVVNLNQQLAKMQTGEWDIKSLMGAFVQVWLPVLWYDFASRGLWTLKKYNLIKDNITTSSLNNIMLHHWINSAMYSMIDAGATAAQWRDINWWEYLLMWGLETIGGSTIALRSYNARMANETKAIEAANIVSDIIANDTTGFNRPVQYTLDENALLTADNRRFSYHNIEDKIGEFNTLNEKIKELNGTKYEDKDKEEERKAQITELKQKQMDLFINEYVKQSKEWYKWRESIPEEMQKKIEEQAKKEQEIRENLEKKKKFEEELLAEDEENVKLIEEFNNLDKEVKWNFSPAEYIRAKKWTDAIEIIKKSIKNWNIKLQWKVVKEGSKDADLVLSQAQTFQNPYSRMILNRAKDFAILDAQNQMQSEEVRLFIGNYIKGLGSYNNLSKENKLLYNKFVKFSIMQNMFDKSYRDELRNDILRENIILEELAEAQRKWLAIEESEIRKIANELLEERKLTYENLKKDIVNVIEENPEKFDEFLDEKKFDVEKWKDNVVQTKATINSTEAVMKAKYISDTAKKKEEAIEEMEWLIKQFEWLEEILHRKNVKEWEIKNIRRQAKKLRYILTSFRDREWNPVPKRDIDKLVKDLDVIESYLEWGADFINKKWEDYFKWKTKEIAKLENKRFKEEQKIDKQEEQLNKTFEESVAKLKDKYNESDELVSEIALWEYHKAQEAITEQQFVIVDNEIDTIGAKISNIFISTQKRINDRYIAEQKEMWEIKKMSLEEFATTYWDAIEEIVETGRKDLTPVEEQLMTVFNENKEDFILTRQVDKMSEGDFFDFVNSENGYKMIESVVSKVERKEKISLAEKKFYDLYNWDILERYKQEEQTFKQWIPPNANPTEISGDIDYSYKGHFDFAIELYKILHTPSVKNRLKAKTISKWPDGVVLDIDNLPLKSPIRKIKKRTINDTIDAMMESPSNLMIGLKHFISIWKDGIKPEKLEKLIELRDFGLKNMKTYDWDVVKDYFYDRLAVGSKFKPVVKPKTPKISLKRKSSLTLEQQIASRKDVIENALHNNTRDRKQFENAKKQTRHLKEWEIHQKNLDKNEKEIKYLEEKAFETKKELETLPKKREELKEMFDRNRVYIEEEYNIKLTDDIINHLQLSQINLLRMFFDRLELAKKTKKRLEEERDKQKIKDDKKHAEWNVWRQKKVDALKANLKKLEDKMSAFRKEFISKQRDAINKSYESDIKIVRDIRDESLKNVSEQRAELKNNLSELKQKVKDDARKKYYDYVRQELDGLSILYDGIDKTKGFQELLKNLKEREKNPDDTMADVLPEIDDLLKKHFGNVTMFNFDEEQTLAHNQLVDRLRRMSGMTTVEAYSNLVKEWVENIESKDLEAAMTKLNIFDQFKITSKRLWTLYKIAVNNWNWLEAQKIKEQYLTDRNRLETLVNNYEMWVHQFQTMFRKDIQDSVRDTVWNLKNKNGLIGQTLNMQNFMKYVDPSGNLEIMMERILMPAITQYEILSNHWLKILKNMKYVLEENGYTEKDIYTLFLAKNQFNEVRDANWKTHYKNNIFVELDENGWAFNIVLKSFKEVREEPNPLRYQPFTSEYKWLLDKKWIEINKIETKSKLLTFDSKNKMTMQSLIKEWEAYTDATYNQLYYNSLAAGLPIPKREKYYMPQDTIIIDENWRVVSRAELSTFGDVYMNTNSTKLVNDTFTKQRTNAVWKEFQFENLTEMFAKKMQRDLENNTVRIPLSMIREAIDREIELQKSYEVDKEKRKEWDEIKLKMIGASKNNMENSFLGNFIEKRTMSSLEKWVTILSSLVTLRALALNPMQFFTQKITLVTDAMVNGTAYKEPARILAGWIEDFSHYSAALANIDSISELIGRRDIWDGVSKWVHKVVEYWLKSSFIQYSDRKVREELFSQWFISALAKWADKNKIDIDLNTQSIRALKLWEVTDRSGNSFRIPDLDYTNMKREWDKRITSIMSSNILGNNPMLINGRLFWFGLLLQKTAMYEMISVASKAFLNNKGGIAGRAAAVWLILAYLAITANISSELNAISSIVSDGVLKYARENNEAVRWIIWLHQNYNNFWEKDSIIYNSLKKLYSWEGWLFDVVGDTVIKGATRMPGLWMFNGSDTGLLTAEWDLWKALASWEIWKAFDYASKVFKIPGVRNALKDLWKQYSDYYKENYDAIWGISEFIQKRDLKEKKKDNAEQYKYLIATSKNWLSQWNVGMLNELIQYKYLTQTENQKKETSDKRYQLAIKAVFEALTEKGTITSANPAVMKHMNLLFSALTESQKKSIIKQKDKDVNDLSAETFIIRYWLDTLNTSALEKKIESMYNDWILTEEQFLKLSKSIPKTRKNIIDRQFEFNDRDFWTNISYEK